MSSHHTLRRSLFATTLLFAIVPTLSTASPIWTDGEDAGDDRPRVPSGITPGQLPNFPGSEFGGGHFVGASDGLGFGKGVGTPRPTTPTLAGPIPTPAPGNVGKVPKRAGPGGPLRAVRGIDAFGGKRGARTNTDESWERWWEQNAFRFLRVPVVCEEVITPASDSMGAVTTDLGNQRFSDATVRSIVLPVLERLLATRESDLVEAAVIPYAQCVPLSDSSRAATTLLPLLAMPERSVRAKTLIALGLTHSRDVLPVLVGIALDQKPGRVALGLSSPVPDELRAASVLALGIFGDPASLRILESLAFSGNKTPIETRAMAVRALGAFSGQNEIAIDALLGVLRDERLADEIRAEAPLALRRLRAESAVPALLKVANAGNVESRLEESCVIAIGALAAPRDRDVIAVLKDRASRDSSAQVRGFALMALSEIAERAVRDEPQANREFTAEIAKFLTSEVEKPSRVGNDAWAAIAAAIASRCLEGFDPVRRSLSESLGAALGSQSNGQVRGAIAIALGLLGEDTHAATIEREFEMAEDRRFAGHLAVSLGMLSRTAASSDLGQRLLSEPDPNLTKGASLGLAQLGARDMSSALVAALAASRNVARIHDLARSLGRLGDRDALQILAKWAGEDSVANVVRAELCFSLGALGQREGKDLRHDVLDVVNYRVESTTLGRLIDLDL